mgnify:FL=1
MAAAGLQPGSHLEVREVDLACKPPELLALHPSGTVPVLQLPNGAVIAESLDIMRWALAQCDPQAWLLAPVPHAAATPKGKPPRTNPAAP